MFWKSKKKKEENLTALGLGQWPRPTSPRARPKPTPWPSFFSSPAAQLISRPSQAGQGPSSVRPPLFSPAVLTSRARMSALPSPSSSSCSQAGLPPKETRHAYPGPGRICCLLSRLGHPIKLLLHPAGSLLRSSRLTRALAAVWTQTRSRRALSQVTTIVGHPCPFPARAKHPRESAVSSSVFW